MDNVANSRAAQESSRRAGVGADLRVVFCCPDCEVRGWVHWDQLPLGMKCRRCKGEFWIGADGKLHSARSAEKVRFACPRCGSKQQLPIELTGRRATCPACGLKCRKNANGDFHAGAGPRFPQPLRRARRRGNIPVWRKVARPRMALSLVVAVILAAIAFAVWRPQSPGVESLERRVHDFTCLSFGGRMDLAADYVVAGQDGRLKVWAALVGATSPGASTRSAQVRVYAASSHERLSHVSVRIEVQKGAQYKSMHTQRWIRSREGIWRFDPQATLRSIVAGEK